MILGYRFKTKIYSSGERMIYVITMILVYILIATVTVYSQKPEGIAKKLANPVGFLSIPFQNNFDFNIKPIDGFKWTMNLQPIIPVSLNKEWNLISRLSLPFISQNDVLGKTSQTGIGDAVVNIMFSPKKSGIICGVGPAFYLPIGSPEWLSAKKWGSGPSVLVIDQSGRVTMGALYFHAWSFAGSDKRPDFSFSYLQPWITYNFKGGWGLTINSEMIDEMKSKMTNGSVMLTGSKLTRIGGRFMNFVLGPKYYFGNFHKPGYGIRATVIFLFPE
jgi:hypothetical protein